MFATIVVIVALSLAVYGMIQGLANLIMPWNKQKQTR